MAARRYRDTMPRADDTPRASSADSIGVTIPGDGRSAIEPGEILSAARRVAEEVLRPNAEESDAARGPNKENFRALADAGLLGLAIPREYGGLGADAATQREYTEILAAACGVTTFVQAQHHGPSRMIADGPNAELKARVLPDLASGRSHCGISFAHLRRPGPPVLCATPVSGGFSLSGTAPWVTGWGLINQLVFGAALPDGAFVYLWSSAHRAAFADVGGPEEGGSMSASAPIPLCAMNASATVALTLRDWFIPEEHRLADSDRETMRRNDRNGVLNGAAMPLGCAAACARLLRETAERRAIPAIARAAKSFASELADARAQVRYWADRWGDADYFDRAVRVRAWCLDLAPRAALACVAASSGAANMLSHPAQRLYREAMFYTIQAQTSEVMVSTLERLERPHK